MNKLKGIFEMSSISKYFGRFGFSLTRSFRYVKRILVLKKKSCRKFSCHSQKNTNRTQVFLLRLSFSLETFIPTELLVMPQMPRSTCCIHPWWYYFISSKEITKWWKRVFWLKIFSLKLFFSIITFTRDKCYKQY